MNPVDPVKSSSPTPSIFTTLSSAIEKCDTAAVEALIEQNAALEPGDFAALCLDFPECALLALSKYPRAALPEKLSNHTLAALGFKESHEQLLIKLIEANMCEECSTLLHLACSNDYYEVVQLLIGRGVKIDAEDEFGNTPFYYAQKFSSDNIVQLLDKSIKK